MNKRREISKSLPPLKRMARRGFPYFAVLLLAVLLLYGDVFSSFSFSQAWAERNIGAEINHIHQERVRLAAVRKSLEKKLGSLGKELHRLDTTLLLARKALTLASQQWQQVNQKVQQLSKKRQTLKKKIQQLQQHMQNEANAAWQRANRQPSWLDILGGVAITEVPHRKYMLRYMLEQQQKDQQQWQEAWLELEAVELGLRTERQHLSRLRDEKKALQRKAQKRLQAKQTMARKMRLDVKLKKQRDKALIRQEKALFQLLEGLKEALLASDKVVQHLSIRKLKGRLDWPLKGRLVAKFGARLNGQQSKMKGVHIAPVSKQHQGRQVLSMADGQVRYADWFGGFGLMMIVEYGDGIIAIYAHNDALHKQLGDWVEAGEVIAEAGSTGWIEKTRLYFELRDHGKAVNPERWCRTSLK
ncbi:MAG: peptidoglycan DD-metalloendopeptidase family protein [Mariprofundaceae bacterium]|nr:peptidoglycan DD-metalloendopeptidase family protein [Mariprofundaceae bacterium]